jgi:ubiquinone/menaquinone biosynthesis C-methylase UbiE
MNLEIVIMPRATKIRPPSLSVNLASERDEALPLPYWEIGKPQSAIENLANRELIVGDVLDVGCGNGENALMLASRGHMVWGIDLSLEAILKARQQTEQQNLEATFIVGNALELDVLGEGFHTVIDSGLFHTLNDKERKKYLRGLAHVMFPGSRAYLLCLSEESNLTAENIHRLARNDFEKYFQEGWKIHKIEATQFELRSEDAPAWLVTIERL